MNATLLIPDTNSLGGCPNVHLLTDHLDNYTQSTNMNNTSFTIHNTNNTTSNTTTNNNNNNNTNTNTHTTNNNNNNNNNNNHTDCMNNMGDNPASLTPNTACTSPNGSIITIYGNQQQNRFKISPNAYHDVESNNFTRNETDLDTPFPPKKLYTDDIPVLDSFPGYYGFDLYRPLCGDTYEASETKPSTAFFFFKDEQGWTNLYAKKTPTWWTLSYWCQRKPPDGSFIRLTPVYGASDKQQEIIQRCFEDFMSIPTVGMARYSIVMVGNSLAEYFFDPITERLCVTLPYETPKEGCEYSQFNGRFMCFNSCLYNGGQGNKKPLFLIITLERLLTGSEPSKGHCEVLGRQCIKFRSCACPKRDKENNERRTGDSLIIGIPTLGKRRKDSVERTDRQGKRLRGQHRPSSVNNVLNNYELKDVNSLRDHRWLLSSPTRDPNLLLSSLDENCLDHNSLIHPNLLNEDSIDYGNDFSDYYENTQTLINFNGESYNLLLVPTNLPGAMETLAGVRFGLLRTWIYSLSKFNQKNSPILNSNDLDFNDLKRDNNNNDTNKTTNRDNNATKNINNNPSNNVSTPISTTNAATNHNSNNTIITSSANNGSISNIPPPSTITTTTINNNNSNHNNNSNNNESTKHGTDKRVDTELSGKYYSNTTNRMNSIESSTPQNSHLANTHYQNQQNRNMIGSTLNHLSKIESHLAALVRERVHLLNLCQQNYQFSGDSTDSQPNSTLSAGPIGFGPGNLDDAGSLNTDYFQSTNMNPDSIDIPNQSRDLTNNQTNHLMHNMAAYALQATTNRTNNYTGNNQLTTNWTYDIDHMMRNQPPLNNETMYNQTNHTGLINNCSLRAPELMDTYALVQQHLPHVSSSASSPVIHSTSLTGSEDQQQQQQRIVSLQPGPPHPSAFTTTTSVSGLNTNVPIVGNNSSLMNTNFTHEFTSSTFYATTPYFPPNINQPPPQQQQQQPPSQQQQQHDPHHPSTDLEQTSLLETLPRSHLPSIMTRLGQDRTVATHPNLCNYQVIGNANLAETLLISEEVLNNCLDKKKCYDELDGVHHVLGRHLTSPPSFCTSSSHSPDSPCCDKLIKLEL